MRAAVAAFITELRRRKVPAVAGTYLAGALTALLAVSQLHDDFGLPEGSPRVVAVVLAVGFPFALVLAWFYDVRRDPGPEGDGAAVEASLTSDRDTPAANPLPRVEPVPGRPSVVVLPFDNFSPEENDAFLAAGLTEEITADLCQVKAVRVISRTSATAAKAQGRDALAIGRELGADFLLEGSVRKAGTRLRVTAQLIGASNDEHLWAEKYDGSMDDIFGMQESVSRQVVEALHLHLTPEEDQRLAEHPVRDLEAYEYYLRARQAQLEFSEPSTRRSIELLEQALKLEGERAVLYAGLGYAWSNLVNLGGAGAAGVRKAEAFLEKALALDPDLPEAHHSLGFLRLGFQGRPLEGLEHLERALEGNPDDPHVLGWLAAGYSLRGRLIPMAHLRDRLVELDPEHLMTTVALATDAMARGDHGGAADASRAWLEHNSGNDGMSLFEAICSALAGDEAVAEQLVEKHFAWPPEGTFGGMAWLVVAALRCDEAMRDTILTETFREGVWLDSQFSYFTASILARGGWHEEAIHWLDHAVSDLQFTSYPFFDGNDPWIARLEGDPRYERLKAQIKPIWEQEMEADRKAEGLVAESPGRSGGRPS